ncbi:hypothetical protein TNCT_315481 [Trichonephila clavata]|uniref:Uncharacterized protein n=1 Tax=Trichonephila clavata TaxID=2740835 RepID=A0A8X6KFZ9_TRICU|nr:hypothetical protein TNCT_315481 [Trichonephila clavata]
MKIEKTLANDDSVAESSLANVTEKDATEGTQLESSIAIRRALNHGPPELLPGNMQLHVLEKFFNKFKQKYPCKRW